MTKLKIENHDELVRDVETQAVLNTDLSSLQSYKKRRDIQKQKDAEMVEIKEEISELKELLQKLLEEKGK